MCMAGSVTDVSVRENPSQQQHNVNNKPQRRRLGLLRRLSSNVSNKNSKSAQKDGGGACSTQVQEIRLKHGSDTRAKACLCIQLVGGTLGKSDSRLGKMHEAGRQVGGIPFFEMLTPCSASF